MSYAIVEIKTGKEVRFFSGDLMPNPVVWPNGDASHASIVGEERAGYRFVKVEYDEVPGEFHSVASAKVEVAGDTMMVLREWQPNDLDETKGVVIERLKTKANDAIMALISPADLARALVAGAMPKWADQVKAIDAQLAKALEAVQSVRTVDEVADIEAAF